MKKGDRNHPNSVQHGNYRIETLKILSENRIKAQVQSGATAHQAMQPSRAERLLYDSYAQEFYGANSRLSLEKNHGQPFRKVCSKSCGSSSAQGGHRIRLRPLWSGSTEAAPHTSIPHRMIENTFSAPLEKSGISAYPILHVEEDRSKAEEQYCLMSCRAKSI